MTADCSILIPTRNGGAIFRDLLAAVEKLAPAEIIVFDSGSTDGTREAAVVAGAIVVDIDPATFNHGGTRNQMAALATGEFLVFLTQDAVPQPGFLEAITRPLKEGCVAAYARQVPRPTATVIDAFHRRWNYPPEGHTRTSADIERLGVKAHFFSNAAAAYRRDAFLEAGGFPGDVLQSEEAVLVARFLTRGHRVAYAADAIVEHSHELTIRHQFGRYFDTGVAFHRARAEMPRARTIRTGGSFARAMLAHVWRTQRRSTPRAILDLSARFMGYRLGHAERRLPTALKRRWSRHPAFWSRPADAPDDEPGTGTQSPSS